MTAIAAPGRVRASRAARWRVVARLARRQVWRTKVSSLLVVVLVALPIAAISAYLVVVMSSTATPQEKVHAELGRMQAWVAPAGVADRGFWQVPTDPQTNGYPMDAQGAMTVPEGSPLSDPTSVLPSGTEVLRIATGSVRADTQGGLAVLRAWSGDAWDPRFAGRFDVVEGRAPTGDDQAMVTPAALKRLGIPIGGKLTLPDLGETFTIVGTLRASELADRESAVFLPGTDAVRTAVADQPRWYLPDTPLPWPAVQKLNEQGVVAYSRDVVLGPPVPLSREARSMTGGSGVDAIVTLLVGAGLFAGYVVVMLAGAAFAVAARRQQRSLAVTASVGADRRDLSRAIRLQGTTLGTVGGVIGVALGIGVAAIVMASVADGSAALFWGFHIPWWPLAAVLVFAVLVGTISALIPARSVARTDVLGSLRGARRPQVPRTTRPIWGSILLIAGVSITIASALVVAALTAANRYAGPWQYIVYGIFAGAIIAQIGILISGHWLLWVLSLALSRTTMAARLASRDAAANAGRTVPAFAAIAATVFIGVFAMSVFAMQAGDSARHWSYQAPVGDLSLSLWPQGAPNGVITSADAEAAASTSLGIAREAGATATAVLSLQQNEAMVATSADAVPNDLSWVVAVLAERYLVSPGGDGMGGSRMPDNNLTVISPSELSTALGATLTDAQLQAYRNGAAVVTDPRYITRGTIDVGSWTGADQYDGRVPNNVWKAEDGLPTPATPSWTKHLDAIAVDARDQPTLIAIAPDTATKLGMRVQPRWVIASFPSAPTVETLDRVTQQANAASGGGAAVGISANLERGPDGIGAWLTPLVVVLSVLVLGASSVALGLARFERRPDDATLAAVGATRTLRRRIGFWQGLVIAGFGTVAGAAAGILAPIGFAIQSNGSFRLIDVPWWVLIAVVVGLPLVIALANWLIPPRHPDLTRRTVIA